MDYSESFTDHDFTPGLDNLVVYEYQEAHEIEQYALKCELECLKESVAQSPARPYIALIAKNGAGKGEIDKLTEKQYQILTGAKWVSFTMKQGAKKLVRKVLMGGDHAGTGCRNNKGQIMWEYALDRTARDLGYEDGEQLRDDIHKVKSNLDRIKELERMV